jgi:hypothetical protein
VTNDIPLGCPLFLPVHTVNCVQTLKANFVEALKVVHTLYALPLKAAIDAAEQRRRDTAKKARVDGDEAVVVEGEAAWACHNAMFSAGGNCRLQHKRCHPTINSTANHQFRHTTLKVEQARSSRLLPSGR